jgi:hypothetical protein
VVPMCVVMLTTSTAAVDLVLAQVAGIRTQWAKASLTVAERTAVAAAGLTGGLIVLLLGCTAVVLAAAAWRIAGARPDVPTEEAPTTGSHRLTPII